MKEKMRLSTLNSSYPIREQVTIRVLKCPKSRVIKETNVARSKAYKLNNDFLAYPWSQKSYCVVKHNSVQYSSKILNWNNDEIWGCKL
jgi:hypothetical protein